MRGIETTSARPAKLDLMPPVPVFVAGILVLAASGSMAAPRFVDRPTPGATSNSSGEDRNRQSSGKTAPPSSPRPRLHVVSTQEEYAHYVRRRPELELVDLAAFIPGIVIDLRYATTDNFMKRALYPPGAKALLVRDAAERLRRAQEDLARLGLGLKIYDAYRPHSVTAEMWRSRLAPPSYVAPPSTGSTHNRGIAVDCTLVDLATGQELAMPTAHDSFEKKAASSYADLPKEILKNRETLKRAMQAQGFIVIRSEWWHYNLRSEGDYPVLDLPFSASSPAAAP